MKKSISSATIFLLLINGFSACYGGLHLILDPTGTNLGLSTGRLLFLPFESYLIPGILLLTLNGISSLIIAGLVTREKKHAAFFVVIQGVVLMGWILIQANVVPNNFTQVFFGILGIILTACGIILSRPKPFHLG